MPMVKDYLYNKFKHGIEAGKFQYGVAQETTSAEVAEILATSDYDCLDYRTGETFCRFGREFPCTRRRHGLFDDGG